jgi:DNA-binding XRE family transcriptional regulator
MSDFPYLATAARMLRAMVGDTQENFSKKLGIDRRQYVTIERNRHDNPLGVFATMADVSGLTYQELDDLMRLIKRAEHRRNGGSK